MYVIREQKIRVNISNICFQYLWKIDIIFIDAIPFLGMCNTRACTRVDPQFLSLRKHWGAMSATSSHECFNDVLTGKPALDASIKISTIMRIPLSYGFKIPVGFVV